jgi:hypothetical protein
MIGAAKNEECEEHTDLNKVTCFLPLDHHEEGLNLLATEFDI